MAVNKWSSGGSTDGNLVANWSLGALAATDDLTFDNTSVVNCTLTAAWDCATITFAVNYTGAFNDGGFGVTNVSGVVTINSGGSFTASGTWTQDADANFTLTASTAWTTTSWKLDLQGTGSLANNSGATRTLSKITAAANTKTTTHNGTWSITIVQWTLGAGTWTNSRTLTVNLAALNDLTLNAAHTLSGASGIDFRANGAITVNIPQINASGLTGAVRFMPLNSNIQTYNLQGAIVFGGNFSILKTTALALTVNTNDYGITVAGIFAIGNGAAGSAVTINIGASAVVVNGSFNTTTTNTEVTNLNLQTSTWTLVGSFALGTLTTLSSGASLITITGTSSITSAGESFYDFTVNSGANTVTLVDALICAAGGDLTLTAGTLNTATFAVTVGGNFSVNGTSTYTGAGTTLTVTGNYTLSATCTYTVGTSVTFNAGAGTQQVTTNGKTISPVIHNGAGGTVQLQDALTTTTITLTAGAFDQNSKAIICTALTWNSNAVGTALSGTIVCSGNIARGAASAGTQAGVITLTGAAVTITSNATIWGPITYNNGAGAFTLVDAFACGALIITAGTATLTAFNSICTSVAVNGVSVLNITGKTLSISGDITLAAGSTFTINAGSTVYFTGVVGTQLITSNGKTFPATIHQGAATAQLQDAFVCAGFTLTSGTFDQNGQSITCTAFTWNTVAATTDLDGAISCSGNITRGAASAGGITGTLTVTGACTSTLNGQSWGPVVLNSGANTLTCADAFACSTLTLTTGIFTTATFAVTMTGNIAVNGVSTLIVSGSTCNFGGDYTTAVGSTITINAGTNYTFTKNGAVVTTNGKALPQITFNSNFSINDSCTITRLIRGVDGFTGTFEATQTFTISNLAAANWSGALGLLNAVRSSVPGTQFTMVLPNAATLTFYDSQDCIYQGFDITANDGTSITRGNNVRYLTMNVVTVLPANGTTAGGTLLTFTDTGNGMGGICVVTVGGAGAGAETVVTPQSLTAITPAGAAGVVNVVITNGDGDTRTLVGAYTYVVPGVGGGIEGGASRCYVGGAAIGI